MNKEKLQEIASTMTEEEFKNKHIVEDNGGDEILNIGGEEFVCPNVIGLRNILSNPTGCCRDCKECWENAIKELKFKEDNMKELNIIEVSKMPNTEFEVIYPSGNKRNKKIKTDQIGNLHDDDGSLFEGAYFHDIIQAKFIPLPKETEVDFMEAIKAVKEGKKVKVIHEGYAEIKEFKEIGKIFEILINANKNYGYEVVDKAISEHILNGKWYIIND